MGVRRQPWSRRKKGASRHATDIRSAAARSGIGVRFALENISADCSDHRGCPQRWPPDEPCVSGKRD
nr:F116 [uncultured bacterium]